MTRVDLGQAPWGIDGCGIPTLGLLLANWALTMARLGDPDDQPGHRQEACRIVRVAVASAPLMFGGTGDFISEAPAVLGSRALVKNGDEGANFADTLMLAGHYQDMPEAPFVPGLEVAGVVAAVGAKVKDWREGDRVLAFLDHGGFADYAVARTRAEGMVGGAWRCWWYRACLGRGRQGARRAGDRNGRRSRQAGGCRRTRCRCLDRLPQGGSARTIKALTAGQGAGVILDPVGGSVFKASLRALAFEGRLLTLGFAGGSIPQASANIVMVKNIAVIGFYWGAYRRRAPSRVAEQMRSLFTWLLEGRLQPRVSDSLPLEEVDAALNLLRNRKAKDKVVISLEEGV